jgi:hypothetical protein
MGVDHALGEHAFDAIIARAAFVEIKDRAGGQGFLTASKAWHPV